MLRNLYIRNRQTTSSLAIIDKVFAATDIIQSQPELNKVEILHIDSPSLQHDFRTL